MNTYYVVGGLAVVVQAVVFLRWIYRRIRDDEINRAFVRDMATNHLPHIYHGMKQIAQANGIELEDPPPVRWIDLNSNGKSWHRMT
jgi:hypothetical protein